MELATILKSQIVHNRVREVGINPNYWNPVGWADQIKRIARFLGLSEQVNQLTTLPFCVQYRYPHYYSFVRGVSTLYLMRLPVGPTESRSFAFFFFKVRRTRWIPKPLKQLLGKLIQRFVLLKFLVQDIEMVESEQQTYLDNKQQRYVEINPAIIAV